MPDVIDDHYINTFRDVLALYEAVHLFEEKFHGTRRCSLHLIKYIELSVHANLEATKRKKRRATEIKRKFAEICIAGELNEALKLFYLYFS